MNLCSQCTYTTIGTPCGNCDCLSVPNIYVHNELVPCTQILEIPIRDLNTCICGDTPVQIIVTKVTPSVSAIDINTERIIIQSVSVLGGDYYEIEYKVSCGEYSSTGVINGYTKDLCVGTSSGDVCDPCTGDTTIAPITIIDINTN